MLQIQLDCANLPDFDTFNAMIEFWFLGCMMKDFLKTIQKLWEGQMDPGILRALKISWQQSKDKSPWEEEYTEQQISLAPFVPQQRNK